MKEVDARGLSCPEPLMLAADAMKAGGPVLVLVDEATPMMNIKKFGLSQGKKVTVTEKGSEFEIVIE